MGFLVLHLCIKIITKNMMFIRHVSPVIRIIIIIGSSNSGEKITIGGKSGFVRFAHR